MRNTLHRAWHWFITDDMRLRRWLRGFLGWLFGACMTITAVGADAMMTWSAKRWILGFAIAALPGFVGLINLGERNPRPQAAPAAAPPPEATP